MEQTFLFADLAGFTALTEAHGDEVAAEIALGFCDDVDRLLPSCGEDLKLIGDSCLLRCEDAACAVELALALTSEVGRRHGLPDVRVGMHRGTAVLRRGEWFGSTINIAARVAAVAGAGEVLATEAAAVPVDGVLYVERGRPALRHIGQPPKLLLATSAAGLLTELVTDPVCRMRIDPARRAAALVVDGVEHSFCSERCASKFAAR